MGERPRGWSEDLDELQVRSWASLMIWGGLVKGRGLG